MLKSHAFFVRSTHTTRSPPHDTPSSTHIIIAPFVVLVFGLYVDGKLGQEGALEGIKKKQDSEKLICTVIPLSDDNNIA